MKKLEILDKTKRRAHMLIDMVSDAYYKAELLKHDLYKTFVKNLRWKDAGLCINIEPCTTIKEIAEGIVNHDMVVKFLKNHCHEEGFGKRYYYSDGNVKYYQVLGLAEGELL